MEVVNASHMYYFKFSSSHVKKKNDETNFNSVFNPI